MFRLLFLQGLVTLARVSSLNRMNRGQDLWQRNYFLNCFKIVVVFFFLFFTHSMLLLLGGHEGWHWSGILLLVLQRRRDHPPPQWFALMGAGQEGCQ